MSNIASVGDPSTFAVNTTTQYGPFTAQNSTITYGKNSALYEFLQDNLRVTEYRDEDGSITKVELQIRQDVGFEWQPIKRAKITSK